MVKHRYHSSATFLRWQIDIVEKGLACFDGFVNEPICGKEASRCVFLSQFDCGHQVQFLQRQFLQDGDLPSTDVLSTQIVSQALTASKVVLERQHLPTIGNAVGFSEPSFER